MTENKNVQTNEADIQERIDGFNKELQPLLGKFELGLGAVPFINPNGTIGANPVILSMRGQAQAETPAEEKKEGTLSEE